MEPTTTNSAPLPQAPVKIGKFKSSLMITKESWNVLKQDKDVMLFPIISTIVTLIASLVFAGALFFIFGYAGDRIESMSETQLDVIGYVIGFLWYLVAFFITNYCMACIYLMVHARFNGQVISFSQSITLANNHVGKIFVWSAISSTVGMILRTIAEKSALAGKIVAALFGAAWNILTYFSLPSLVIGNRSIKDSFHESANLIRKTWGEAIIVNLGVGAFFGMLVFLSIALSVGIVILVPTMVAMIIVGVLLLIALIVMAIVSSTLTTILNLALYEYASTGKVPQGFTPELIQRIIVAKK